jgi:hypothetical protein
MLGNADIKFLLAIIVFSFISIFHHQCVHLHIFENNLFNFTFSVSGGGLYLMGARGCCPICPIVNPALSSSLTFYKKSNTLISVLLMTLESYTTLQLRVY